MELTIRRNTSGINKKKNTILDMVSSTCLFFWYLVWDISRNFIRIPGNFCLTTNGFFYKGNAANANEHN